MPKRTGSADNLRESPRVMLGNAGTLRRGSIGTSADVRSELARAGRGRLHTKGGNGVSRLGHSVDFGSKGLQECERDIEAPEPVDVVGTVCPDKDPQAALTSEYVLPLVKLELEPEAPTAADADGSDDGSSIDDFNSAEEAEPEDQPQAEPEPQAQSEPRLETNKARRNSVMLDIESGLELQVALTSPHSSDDELPGETKPLVTDVVTVSEAGTTLDGSDRSVALHKVWKSVDIDGSGSLDRDEVRSVLVQMGWENITSARLDDVFEELDKDKSGDVDFDEFSVWFLAQDTKSIEMTMIGSGLTDQEMMQMMAAAATLEASTLQKDGKTPRGRASHKVDEKMYVDDSYVEQLKDQNDSYPLGVISGLKDNERRALKNCETFNGARVQLAQSWVVRSITRRRKAGGLGVDAPVLATGIYRSYQNSNEAFQQCKKIVDTPFPLPYAQAVLLMLIAWMLFTPFLICEIVNGTTLSFTATPRRIAGTGSCAHGYHFLLVYLCATSVRRHLTALLARCCVLLAGMFVACLISFLAVFAFALLNEVARDLEDPFGHAVRHMHGRSALVLPNPWAAALSLRPFGSSHSLPVARSQTNCQSKIFTSISTSACGH